MIHELTSDVLIGNWESPFECASRVRAIINVAHHFSVRRGRNVYWQRLAEIRHDVLYFRLAKKDRDDVDDAYMALLAGAVDSAKSINAFPLLTHCQMGGHRGPSAGLFAAWHLGGRSATLLEELHSRVLVLVPGLVRGRNYYHSLIAWCRKNSHVS